MHNSNDFFAAMEKDFWSHGKIVLYAAAFAHLVFLALFTYMGFLTLAYLNITSVIIYLICIHLLKTNNYKTILFLAQFEVIAHTLVATYFLGIRSGFHYYIYLLIVINFIDHQASINRKIIKLMSLIFLYFLINEYFYAQTPLIALNHNELTFFHYFNMSGFFMIGFPIMNFAIRKYTDTKTILYEYATIDPLTRLYNRRHLMGIIEYIFNGREDNVASIIMIDIDHFKSINDTFGHQCGDIVLQNLAKTIQNELRKSDTPSRWGGEEFLILLPERSLENAFVISERIRTKMQEVEIPCPEHKVIRITLTAGVATRQENESFNSMLERADLALYRGKNEGRNRSIAA